jgi:hypothetical protein
VAGKSKYIIDTAELEKLASYGCTVKECAEFFGCPDRLLSTPKYKGFYTKGFNSTKKRLRMAQIKLALSGNATMLIWLGKNYLDQSDKNEMNMNVNATEISKEFAKMVQASGAGSAT